MENSLGERLKHAWNAFNGNPMIQYRDIGSSYSYRPDRVRISGRNERSMVTQNVDPNVYIAITAENMREINEYIDDPMTATQIRKKMSRSSGNKQITNELIYYWMVALHIPFECQKWHLSRLLTLIEVANIEGQPQKKMSQRDTIRSNAEINAERRRAMNSKG